MTGLAGRNGSNTQKSPGPPGLFFERRPHKPRGSPTVSRQSVEIREARAYELFHVVLAGLPSLPQVASQRTAPFVGSIDLFVSLRGNTRSG